MAAINGDDWFVKHLVTQQTQECSWDRLGVVQLSRVAQVGSIGHGALMAHGIASTSSQGSRTGKINQQEQYLSSYNKKSMVVLAQVPMNFHSKFGTFEAMLAD
jgi:hypothetical protein